MKRCQQCNFVYEDDQCQCDLDGAELVYASTIELPSPLRAATQTKELPPTTPRRRHFIALSLAGAVLGTIFVLAYNSLSNRTTPVNTPTPPVIATANSELLPHQELALPDPETTPAPTPSPATEVKTVKRSAPVAPRTPVDAATPALARQPTVISTPVPARTPVPIRTPTPAPTPQAKKPLPPGAPTPGQANQQKDSNVGSLLKKAVRILKKPFKF